MKIQNTFSGASTKAKCLSLCTLLAVAASGQLHAQNTSSYNANAVPIGGPGNCAFGQGTLSSTTTGGTNTAIGFHALLNNTTGTSNAATGANALVTNTTGYNNTANGYGTLYYNTSGTANTATGTDALSRNTTGQKNVATGAFALNANTEGRFNVATGSESLYSNTTGIYNTATGSFALFSNTTGYENVATGSNALRTNTTGIYNTATGSFALFSNTTANYNVATGYNSLRSNTIGYDNVATGYNSLRSNTTGSGNVATGTSAMYSNRTGVQNVAAGLNALRDHTQGNYNVAIGSHALQFNTTSSNSVAIGAFALGNNTSGAFNTATGTNSLLNNVTGNYNTALGYNADVKTGALTNATAIGYGAVVNADNKVMIGNSFVTKIEGYANFTNVSDGRFKTNIKEEDVKGLAFIQKLRPVVYNFNTRKFTEFLTKNMPDSIRRQYLDKDFTASTNIRHSGFIAQEVEAAAKDVNYDFNGVHIPENENDNYSLAYAQFVVPLVKAVQEQQKMIEDLQQQILELQKGSGNTTGISDLPMPGASMDQNVPNPFSRETIINFNLPLQVKSASLVVHDLAGNKLRTIPVSARGAASVTITAEELAAGTYVYSILADGRVISSKKMVIANE